MKKLSMLVGAGLLSASLAHAAGPFDGWTKNGTAALNSTGDVLQLTPGAPGGSAGSAWAPTTVSFAKDFSLSFDFSIFGGSAADGLAVVFQRASAGTSALGNAGGGLGYEGISNSVAVVFDTFDNGYSSDSAGANVGYAFGGNMNDGGSTGFSPTTSSGVPAAWSLLPSNWLRSNETDPLNVDPWYVWVNYDADNGAGFGTLSVRMSLDADPANSIEVESFQSNQWATKLGGSLEGVNFGFTAATGSLTDNHNIEHVLMSQTTVPEPESVALVLAGLAVIGGMGRRRARAHV